MLTAKELQQILKVDRSTVYRMAEDGRLPAIKVGRQWRFSPEEIETWLGREAFQTPAAECVDDSLAAQLPLECVQLMLDTYAQSLQVMLIVTDMSGNAITEFSNACGLFSELSSSPQFWNKCMEHWQEMASDLALTPTYEESFLGLLCARGYIRDGSELKGMVFLGGIAPKEWPPRPEKVAEIARELDLPEQKVSEHVQEVFNFTPEQRDHILEMVQPIANVISHILHERKQFLAKSPAMSAI